MSKQEQFWLWFCGVLTVVTLAVGTITFINV